jgi:hypothetical protein
MSPAAAPPAIRALQRGIESVAARWPLPPWLTCAAAIIGLAAFAYIPLLGGGLIVTADTSQAMRIYELHRCLSDGQLPCRWVPDLGNGYGYPLFNYYPPLPYYAGNALHGIGLSYVRAADLLFAFGLIGAGLTMFALARRLWGDLGGLVSALAYIYAPYLALDVFLRGALPELWALAIAPALFWALYELVTTGRARFVLLAALSGALLLLSHNLVAVIVAPAVVFWTAALLALRGREAWRPALLTALAGVWAFGLAAFFTLPMLTEGGQVQLDSLTRGYFHYSLHFASVGDLFLSRSADYSFLLGGRGETPLQIGWFHWGLAALALPVAFLLLRAGRRREVVTVALLALFFAIGVFMATSASRPIWDAFHPLRFLQFPWRYLGLVSLAAAALAGASLALLRGRPAIAQLGITVVLIGLFIGSGRTFFQPLHRCDLSDAEVLSGVRAADAPADRVCDVIIEHPEGAAIHDYLPKAVAAIPDPPVAPARVVDGSAQIEAVSSGSDWLRLRIEAQTPARIEAALFDYPNWRVRIDGQVVAHETSSPHGLITFAVPPGAHEVSLHLEDTFPRRAGNALSFVSWGAFGIAVGVLLLAPGLRRLSGAA